MEKLREDVMQHVQPVGADFIARLREDGWIYSKTVIDITHEPLLILSDDLRVIAANEPFYAMFRATPDETEGKRVYELGNGEWDIPALRHMLTDILSTRSFFKGFEVNHDFPHIGRKTMLLNARQIYCKEDVILAPCPPLIVLAIEDITEMVTIASMLADTENLRETGV